MAFAISAHRASGLISITRTYTGSAVLLADLWQRMGYRDIRIEWGAYAVGLDAFREQLGLTRDV